MIQVIRFDFVMSRCEQYSINKFAPIHNILISGPSFWQIILTHQDASPLMSNYFDFMEDAAILRDIAYNFGC